MKITAEHRAQLKTMIEAVDTDFRREINQKLGIQPDSELYRWNTLYAVPVSIRGPWIDQVYTYAKDTHISSALRAIIVHPRLNIQP